MGLILTGVVNGMRPVGGVVEKGPRAGEVWNFISFEITDPRYGKVYSCQLRSNDKQYKDWVETRQVTENGKQVNKYVLKQGADLTGHKVKVAIMGISAGIREIEDKETKEKREIIQQRMQITNIRDLGEPDDEE